jgi:hypothetical protein
MNRTSNLEKRIKLKFERQFAAFQRRSTQPISVIDEEIAFYGTTIDDCKCGETHLIRNLYKRDVPCRHMQKLGAPLPDLNLHKIYVIGVPKFHQSIMTKFVKDNHTPFYRGQNRNIVPDTRLNERERGSENRIAFLSTYIPMNLLSVVKKRLHDAAIPIFEELFMTPYVNGKIPLACLQLTKRISLCHYIITEVVHKLRNETGECVEPDDDEVAQNDNDDTLYDGTTATDSNSE